LFSFPHLFIYLSAAGLFGFVFARLQWQQAKYFENLNNELAQTNSFLSSISTKISKYLPPQIYHSIFSGQKDVDISTERKKLTIFFSDIKDFSLSTEHLQPEELTLLVNEYFSEMAAIASAHGATVNKFIGDAILAFFGDPESRGVAQDARACLDMAIAMQRRLVELGAEWRGRGIERPFMARMGINTGYCNVGNFGSLDRVDYTIIGAEANLAARLQSIAEPGGIVLSYETYAHVKDMVKATQLKPITLKGIVREIIPYRVDSIYGEGREASVIHVDENDIKVFVNIDKLDSSDRDRVRRILSDTMRQLDRA
jgi:class 3 adenylate cyclase